MNTKPKDGGALTWRQKMTPQWQDAGELARFYKYFGKRLEVKGWFLMFGYAFCWARVATRVEEGEK